MILASSTDNGSEPPPTTCSWKLDAIVPLADVVRDSLEAVQLVPIRTATPLERARLVQLHDALAALEAPVRARREGIELGFKRAAIELGADQIRTSDGVVRIEPPRTSYRTNEQGLRDALDVLAAAGHISRPEVDEAVTTIVAYRIDHAKLNYLARHRGPEVAAAIEANRERIEGNPMGRPGHLPHEGRPTMTDEKALAVVTAGVPAIREVQVAELEALSEVLGAKMSPVELKVFADICNRTRRKKRN